MSLVLGCPYLQEQNTDFYAYKLPIFVLLIANSFFLVWIMVVRGFIEFILRNLFIVSISDYCVQTES